MADSTPSLQKFAGITTIHGIHDLVFTEGKILKILWFSMICLSVSALIYQIYTASKEFSEKPTTTQVSQKYLHQYPSITLCSTEWYNHTKLETSYGPAFSRYFAFLFESTALTPGIPFNTSNDEALASVGLHDNEQETFFGIVKEEGIIYLEQILDETIINPKKSQLIYSLDSVEPFEFKQFHSKHGACFVVISPDYKATKALKMSQPARQGKFNVAVDEFKFVKLAIGDDFEIFEPKKLPGEQDYTVVISSKYIITVNSSDNPCGSERMQMPWITCADICFHSTLPCSNCYTEWLETGMPNRSLDHYCTPKHLFYRSGDDEFDIEVCEDEHEREDACVENCYPPWKRWEYKVEINAVKKEGDTSKLPARLQSRFPQQHRYVEHLEEKYIYTWTEFVSNLGGILSLFTGASVISLFHAFFFWSCVVHKRSMEEGNTKQEQYQAEQRHNQAERKDSKAEEKHRPIEQNQVQAEYFEAKTIT